VQVEHFSKRFPGMTIEDGYAVSRAWVAQKIAAGRTVRGHKIGLTSRAMQLSSQIDEPDYGTLLDDMFFEPGAIPANRFIAPRVEVELAFVLKRKLEGDQVLGGKRVKPRDVDLPWCGAILRQNGAVEETGLAAGVQGHPAIGVAWLAKKLAPWGEGLQAGEVVLAGSFTRPAVAKPGDRFDADYGPLGRFEFHFQ
jgi:2-oxo-hept-3-ene-1,7-dioate hydratase